MQTATGGVIINSCTVWRYVTVTRPRINQIKDVLIIHIFKKWWKLTSLNCLAQPHHCLSYCRRASPVHICRQTHPPVTTRMSVRNEMWHLAVNSFQRRRPVTTSAVRNVPDAKHAVRKSQYTVFRLTFHRVLQCRGIRQIYVSAILLVDPSPPCSK